MMYAGSIVEQAPVLDFFSQPRHPYTLGLLASRPRLGVDEDIPVIPGNVPDLIDRPAGCAFHPRCRWATAACWPSSSLSVSVLRSRRGISLMR